MGKYEALIKEVGSLIEQNEVKEAVNDFLENIKETKQKEQIQMEQIQIRETIQQQPAFIQLVKEMCSTDSLVPFYCEFAYEFNTYFEQSYKENKRIVEEMQKEKGRELSFLEYPEELKTFYFGICSIIDALYFSIEEPLERMKMSQVCVMFELLSYTLGLSDAIIEDATTIRMNSQKAAMDSNGRYIKQNDVVLVELTRLYEQIKSLTV